MSDAMMVCAEVASAGVGQSSTRTACENNHKGVDDSSRAPESIGRGSPPLQTGGRNDWMRGELVRCRAHEPGPYLLAMATLLKDLRLWQEAVALAADVVRAVRAGSRRETKSFTDELMGAAGAVAAGIADAHCRYVPEEQQASYRETKRALAVLETRLAIARQADLIPAATLSQCSTRAANVGRLLSGYLGHLERILEVEERGGAGKKGAA